jgi:hypothetical protein
MWPDCGDSVTGAHTARYGQQSKQLGPLWQGLWQPDQLCQAVICYQDNTIKTFTALALQEGFGVQEAAIAALQGT